ncbi:MAG TPA: TIM-barrel domain-containing protein [Cellulomonas sp.]
MPVDRHAPELLQGEHYRITPLTPRLVRLEWAPDGAFEDRPTMFAIDRGLRDGSARVHRDGDRVVVTTERYELRYDGERPSPHGLSVRVGSSIWRPGADDPSPAQQRARDEGRPYGTRTANLGGAARTLDGADGAVPLEDGVSSVDGIAVLDDSRTMVLTGDGPVADRVPRPRRATPGYRDLYVFAAGSDHVAAVGDLFRISGPQPLLPRWALGSWWSRYHRYTQDSYLELIERFRALDLPLSVAVLDMDWHLVDVDPAFGTGWTGYTWNRELFPDPEQLQRTLHEHGLAVALNVHPADGVRAFEDAYEPMCRALGRPADGTPIRFDPSDPAFMRAYIDVLHRDLETQGTDLWWVDWQQGSFSDADGMDPLWVLNHTHYAGSTRTIPEGLTFSRYAGPGSHRYPVGFSGDTIISWASLAFQPRFTAAGANIGYGWWSHDIGGHADGRFDPELFTRWVQLGVFSPILRLHSSSSEFSGKEPWRFDEPHAAIQGAHLRLRHRLLPYLHTMNRRAHLDGRSLVEPLYFEEPNAQTYRYLDAYLFGSELLVAPITRPSSPDTARGATEVYLPAGGWIDVFTAQTYAGGRTHRLHRDLHSAPVLLRAGGFLPLAGLDERPSARENPAQLEVLVGAGAPGRFDLWEEPAAPSGSAARTTDPRRWPRTGFAIDPEARTLRIDLPGTAPVADGQVRSFVLTMLGFDPDAFEEVRADGARVRVLPAPPVDPTGPVVVADRPGQHAVRLLVEPEAGAGTVVLRSPGFAGTPAPRRDDARLARLVHLLQHARIGFPLKDEILRAARLDLASVPVAARAFAGARHDSGQLDHTADRPTPELLAAIDEVLGG